MKDFIQVKRLIKPFDKTVSLPGSKSLSIRDLSISAIAKGESVIKNLANCDDVDRMIDAINTLQIPNTYKDDLLHINGNNGEFTSGKKELYLGGSGASTRILLSILALRKFETIIDGDSTLRSRPQKYLVDSLKELGAKIDFLSTEGCLPLIVKNGIINKNSIKIKGDISSQYISSLLISAPYFPEGLEIFIEGELVSKPYIHMTIREMERFGIKVKNIEDKYFKVEKGSYIGTYCEVESDASAASYFMTLATIHNSKVNIQNLGSSSIQGDLKYYKICQMLGADIKILENSIEISGPNSLNPLQGEINFEDIPDTAPTLISVSPLIPGKTKMTGLSTLKVKECNRFEACINELQKFDVEIEYGDDWIEVGGFKNKDILLNKEIVVETYDDHRMAMSFASLGTAIGNVNIIDPKCVNKTFPKYWKELEKLY